MSPGIRTLIVWLLATLALHGGRDLNGVRFWLTLVGVLGLEVLALASY